MKSSWAWTGLLAAGAIAALTFACSSSGGGGFPYSGPSCTTNEISASCWSCVQANCDSVSKCVTGDCSAYSQCYCKCQAGDATCQATCFTNASPSCQKCANSGLTCSACNSQCAGGPFSGSSSGGVSEGGACVANTATVTCMGTDLPCSPTRCCGTSTPYHCEVTGMCYPSEAEAQAACGSTACVTCGAPSGSGGSCTQSTVTGAGCATGSLGCNATKCCPPNMPYYCDSSMGGTCYATAGDANAICGASCTACSP